MGIGDFLVRIWIPGSVPLTNESGSSVTLMMQYKLFFPYFGLPTGTLSSVLKIRFFAKKFCVKILFCKHYFSPLNTFMRKGKDPEPDPYLLLVLRNKK